MGLENSSETREQEIDRLRSEIDKLEKAGMSDAQKKFLALTPEEQQKQFDRENNSLPEDDKYRDVAEYVADLAPKGADINGLRIEVNKRRLEELLGGKA